MINMADPLIREGTAGEKFGNWMIAAPISSAAAAVSGMGLGLGATMLQSVDRVTEGGSETLYSSLYNSGRRRWGPVATGIGAAEEEITKIRGAGLFYYGGLGIGHAARGVSTFAVGTAVGAASSLGSMAYHAVSNAMLGESGASALGALTNLPGRIWSGTKGAFDALTVKNDKAFMGRVVKWPVGAVGSLASLASGGVSGLWEAHTRIAFSNMQNLPLPGSVKSNMIAFSGLGMALR